MTQQEKALEILDWVFLQPRYARTGVSEKFLRDLAKSRWVGKDEKLSAGVLIETADVRVALGELLKFKRGQTAYYKLP
jgi:hypothetical protein